MNQAAAFVAQDFTQLPEGQSEALDLNDRYRIMVSRDPFRPAQFLVTLINLDNHAWRQVVSPLEDIKRHLAMAIESAADAIATRAQIIYYQPNLE